MTEYEKAILAAIRAAEDYIVKAHFLLGKIEDGKFMPRSPTGEMLYAAQAALAEQGKTLTAAEIGAVWRTMFDTWRGENAI